MKVKIDKELDRVSKQDKKVLEQSPLNDVKLLLSGDATEDARIMRGLSNNSQFNRLEYFHGKKLELEKLENDYEGKVYTIDQIKGLAMDYNLRFLTSNRFVGAYDVEVVSKLKEFAKATNSPIDDYSLGRRYYVLAPEEQFDLREQRHVTKREIRAELRRQMDPAIFFQIDENNYRLVHKWGSDFTILRYLSGFRHSGWWTNQLFNTVMVMPIVAFLYALVLNFMFVANYPILFGLITTLTSFVFAYFRWGFGRHDEHDAVEGYFTYGKWNSGTKVASK